MPRAGQIIRALDFPETVEGRQASSHTNFNSGSFAAASPPCNMTGVAGTSGRVYIPMFIRIAADGSGEYVEASVEVRETDGSGTVVHSPSEAVEGIDYRPATSLNQNMPGWVYLSGLTPGQVYWTEMKINSGGNSIDVLEQVILWMPQS